MHLAPALLNEFFKETYYPSQAVVYYDLACVLEPNHPKSAFQNQLQLQKKRLLFSL